MKKICTVFLFFIYYQAKTQVCFNPVVHFNTAVGFNVDACSADFNGDGKLDLATNNRSILLGTGTGSFQTATSFSPIGTSPGYITGADFNGDLNGDFAITTNSLIEVFLGNGTGTFSIPTNTILLNTPTSFANDYVLTSADFNLDGKPDLVTANSASNSVSVFLGNGTGNFSGPTIYPVGAYPIDILSRDLNGDGKTDLVTANNSSNDISILLGTGAGSFSSAINFSSTPSIRRMDAADFNGDGNIDIIGTDFIKFYLLFGNGAGGMGPVVTFSVSGLTTAFGVVCGDFNSDSKADFAVTDNNLDNIGIILGTGTGTFLPVVTFGPTKDPYGIICGDFNGDSKMDIVTANDNTITVSYFQNCNTVDVDDINRDNAITVYPNPASNNLYISTNETEFENSEIEIINYLGQTVLKTKFASELDVSELSNGFYILQLKNPQNKIAIKRLVIAK